MGPDAQHSVADLPQGADAKKLPACDLVMKGGITSGVVYPSLVMRLAEKYRFASIGGTSAGAIAAAVCGAAEYARQRGESVGGMSELAQTIEQFKQPDFVLGLFQPTPDTRPLFEVLLNASMAKTTMRRRLEQAAIAAAWRRPEIPTIALVLLAALVTLTVASFGSLPTGLAAGLALVVALPLALLIIGAAGLVSLALLVRRAVRSLKESDYGFCPGTNQAGPNETALIDWLHGQIQTCAGRDLSDPPLTFGDLRREGIRLAMMTTDLSFARPIRVPDELGSYTFDPADLRERFPQSVVNAMLPKEAREDERNAQLRQTVPEDDLPVLVGVRLSLSFPFLLSAMPLYLPNPGGEPEEVRHLFSDGGIASNFPVHFFDDWFPGRPTFGIDLAELPDESQPDVFMPKDPKEFVQPRWSEIDSVLGFVGGIKDTMQNWRDTMQSELPGFRDRVCQIRFRKGQGGLYLDMDEQVIQDLVRRGDEAGSVILNTFNERQWEQHRFVRYLMLMSLLQGNLQGVKAAFAEFAPALRRGLPEVRVYREGRDQPWCERADKATTGVVTLGELWGPHPREVDFRGPDGPLPAAELRMVPKA
jgi:predicted acylesterase/phospholipase RssA